MIRSLLVYWYYGTDFEKGTNKAIAALAAHGYEQVPAGSISPWAEPENYRMLVENASKIVAGKNLSGFMMTSWRPTLEKYREDLLGSIETVASAHSRDDHTL